MMTREEILRIAKPILLNTNMVRAILDGRKTVTRRKVEFLKGKNPNWTGYVRDGHMLYNGTNEPCIKPPRYIVNDYLYVRETIRLIDFSYIDGDWSAGVEYRADNSIGTCLHMLPKGAQERIGWRPSVHMPKEAARIFLKVTDVKVERLQDIDGIGCEREGAITINNPYIRHDKDTYDNYGRKFFSALWDSTIPKKDLKKYGWDASPWVWVIEFERVEV